MYDSVFLLKIPYTKHSVLLNLLLSHSGPWYPGLHPYEQVPFKRWHWVTFKQFIHSVWHPFSYVPFSHSIVKYANEKKNVLGKLHIMTNIITIIISRIGRANFISLKKRTKQLLILNKGDIQNNFIIQYQSAIKDFMNVFKVVDLIV